MVGRYDRLVKPMEKGALKMEMIQGVWSSTTHDSILWSNSIQRYISQIIKDEK